MIVLDTRKDTKYKGCISVACKLLKQGDCDEIITKGSDFICIKYEDLELGERIRGRALKKLDNSEIRYIVIARDKEGTTESLFLASKYTLQSDIAHSIFFKTREEAEKAITNLKDFQEYSLDIEEYLYRLGNSCRLRIYHTIKGLKTDYGILQFIKQQISSGYLEERIDSKGKSYIWLDDLLVYKDEMVTFKSAQNVSYKRKFDLELLLHDGLIAFDGISRFVEQHPEYKIPEVKYLTANNNAQSRRRFYDLGAVFYQDDKIQEVACKELGLYEWL